MNRFWTRGGKGEEPLMQTRIDVKSHLPSSGLANSAEYMVGTPQKTVTLCFCIASKALAGSNRGIITIFAAKLTGTVMLVVMP
jgi:hypothetical protein